MEQDKDVGRYRGQREKFDYDWDEREYIPTGISFQDYDFKVLDETPKKKYIRLVKSHPWLKTIVLAPDTEDEGVKDVEFEYATILDYVVQDGEYFYKHMALAAVDAMCENTEDMYPGLSDEEKGEKYIEARKEAWKVINGLEWKRAIFLWVKQKEENDGNA